MNEFLDKKYIDLVSVSLEGFRWIRSTCANLRCPICGDSDDKKKKRGYFFRGKQSYVYTCHNCGVNLSLHSFLERLQPDLLKEYRMEKFKDTNKKRRVVFDDKDFSTGINEVFKKKYNEKVESKYLTSVTKLPSDHPAREFIRRRMIPKSKYDLLYFTNDFRGFSEELTGDDHSKMGQEERIVIPFFDRTGKMVAAQGRALTMKSVTGSNDRRVTDEARKIIRYITLRSNNAPDVLWYGQYRVDPKKKIYIVEGPLDSLFIDNAIAMVGASSINHIPEHLKDSEGVYVLDNEPRNAEIVRLNKKLLDMGRNICVWPSWIQEKDINDMILGGHKKKEIKDIIDKNTYGGLMGSHKLRDWSRA